MSYHSSRLQAIVDLVAATAGLTPAELTARGRDARRARPRQLAAWLMRQGANPAPYAAIAAWLGWDDHTTAIYAADKVAALMRDDEALRAEAEQLLAALDTPRRAGLRSTTPSAMRTACLRRRPQIVPIPLADELRSQR